MSGVSVVIAAHTMDRWEQIGAAVRSALAQVPTPVVVVAVDHNEPLRAALADAFPEITVVTNEGSRGASGTRNSGARTTSTEFIAFLDDDATALAGWLYALLAPFSDPKVVGTGGRVEPAWRAPRPNWFPDEFLWAVGASFAGMGAPGPVRNVWAENMAVRRSRFIEVGGFREDFGKVGQRSRPEDTDLGIRMARADQGETWIYAPDAVVVHDVPASRTTFRFFAWRCRLEGGGKYEMRRLFGQDRVLGVEARYLAGLPRVAVLGLLTAARERRLAPASRAAAITVGVMAAGFGFAEAALDDVRRRARAMLAPRRA